MTAKEALLNNIIEETKSYTFDSDNSRGLFGKSNKISGERLLTIAKRDTLLRRAQYQYLITDTVDTHQILTVNSSISFAYEVYKNSTSNYSLSLQFTNNDVSKVENNLIREFPVALKGWICESDYINYVKTLKDTFLQNCRDNKYIPFVTKLNKLKELLQDTDFVVHYGPAGSGKSTSIISTLKNKTSRQAIVTLSNTIGCMFKQKVPAIENFSCAKLDFLYGLEKCKQVNYDDVVIDEFSQWGFEQLDLFISILEYNPKAKIYIMGDINQIPTFLSSGSLLFSIITEFKNNCVEHKEVYRQQGKLKYDIDSALKGKITFQICGLQDDLLKNMDCIITGSNVHVKDLNEKMIKLKLGNYYSDDVAELLIRLDGSVPLELICNTTSEINNTKIYTNERFNATYTGGNIVLNSYVDKNKQIILTHKQYLLLKRFDYGYAITVNKAQGLEWNNVAVYLDYFDTKPKSKDLNVKSLNSIYVALSRGRMSTMLTTNQARVQQMTMALSRSINTKYKFFNNFEQAGV